MMLEVDTLAVAGVSAVGSLCDIWIPLSLRSCFTLSAPWSGYSQGGEIGAITLGEVSTNTFQKLSLNSFRTI